MTFSVYGEILEGEPAKLVLPYSSSQPTVMRARAKAIAEHLRQNGTIHLQFTKGVRKGTIGRLTATAEEIDDLYDDNRSSDRIYMRSPRPNWFLVFDDRNNKVAVETHDLPGIMLFDAKETAWSYETVAREKKPSAVLYDHFGVQLEVGQLVLVPQGSKGDIHTRFAYIKGITAAGTIKVESIKTRKGHGKVESNVSPTINASDLVVLEGTESIKSKVLKAKLTHG